MMHHELTLRLGCFFTVFLGMALWEWRLPRRALSGSKPFRWAANLGLVVVDSVLVKLLFQTAAVGTAMLGESRGWGWLNNSGWSPWLTIPLALLILDGVIYLQHVVFHAVPALWRLHMVHHADVDIDLTTAVRFHPIEIALSMLLKIAVVAALGPPATAVLVFEVLLNATAMFNHSNVRMPLSVDRRLRLLIVTPDMHRVHHSIEAKETNSNFGFNFPWWDRLFGTYQPQPGLGHEDMSIGLQQFNEPRRQSLWWLLMLPFKDASGNYPIYRRR